MTTFVLVHGAWHGSWCWSRVRALLTANGHDVHTPTLTGLGERSHLLSPAIGLQTHVNDVANLIRWERLRDVVLVGHSYAGMVIREVAEHLPDRLAHLVYLDAFVPEDGKCLHDYALGAEENIRASAQPSGGWAVPPFSAAFLDVNEADRAWVDAQCTPHPLSSFETPVTLTAAGEAVPASYILAADNSGPFFPPIAARFRASGRPCHTLPGGHDLMIDSPQALADLLTAIAAKSEPSPTAPLFSV